MLKQDALKAIGTLEDRVNDFVGAIEPNVASFYLNRVRLRLKTAFDELRDTVFDFPSSAAEAAAQAQALADQVAADNAAVEQAAKEAAEKEAAEKEAADKAREESLTDKSK